MDRVTAERLSQMTQEFYERYASSFSATRARPWDGWNQLACLIDDALPVLRVASHDGAFSGAGDTPSGDVAARESAGQDTLRADHARVLDAGCGNCRFERFLAGRFPQISWEFLLVDSCSELIDTVGLESCRVYDLDIARELLRVCDTLPMPEAGRDDDRKKDDLKESLHAREMQEPTRAQTETGQSPSAVSYIEESVADRPLLHLSDDGGVHLAVAFGLMHHLPTFAQRKALLQLLMNATRPGGVIAVSFWQFMDDERMARKAREITREAESYLQARGIDPAQLGKSDYLLDWQNDGPAAGLLRFCHHFADDEIQALIAEGERSGRLIGRFQADGASGAMNCYLVFQR